MGTPVEVLHVGGQLLHIAGARDHDPARHGRPDEFVPWAARLGSVHLQRTSAASSAHGRRCPGRPGQRAHAQASLRAVNALLCMLSVRGGGEGHATRASPETETEPMGLRKVTMGARFTKGICTSHPSLQAVDARSCQHVGRAGRPGPRLQQARMPRTALAARLVHDWQGPHARCPQDALLGVSGACRLHVPGDSGPAAHHEAEQGAVAVDEEAVLSVALLLQDGQDAVQVVHCTLHSKCQATKPARRFWWILGPAKMCASIMPLSDQLDSSCCRHSTSGKATLHCPIGHQVVPRHTARLCRTAAWWQPCSLACLCCTFTVVPTLTFTMAGRALLRLSSRAK